MLRASEPTLGVTYRTVMLARALRNTYRAAGAAFPHALPPAPERSWPVPGDLMLADGRPFLAKAVLTTPALGESLLILLAHPAGADQLLVHTPDRDVLVDPVACRPQPALRHYAGGWAEMWDPIADAPAPGAASWALWGAPAASPHLVIFAPPAAPATSHNLHHANAVVHVVSHYRHHRVTWSATYPSSAGSHRCSDMA